MEGDEGTQQQPPVLPAPYRAASDAQPMNPPVKKKTKRSKASLPDVGYLRRPSCFEVSNPDSKCCQRSNRMLGPHSGATIVVFSPQKKKTTYKEPTISSLERIFISLLSCVSMLEAVWVNPPTLTCCKLQFLLKKTTNST